MLLSLDPEMGRFGESLTSEVRHLRIAGFRYAGRERSRKAFLPLLATTDSTFAQVGRRTRKNIQQCRQKTHEEIGCSLDENVQISRTSLLKMNRSSMYAVSDQIAEWRYDRLSDVMAGMKDHEGRWLSLIGCRRLEGNVEILWQMDLNGYPHLSLSLVARSFLIESKIQRGTQALMIEGGATHALHPSFVEQTILDIALVRKSLRGKILGALARRAVQGSDELGLMLSRDDLIWHDA